MAFEQRSLDDYIDVAQRIADFREKYPEGTLAPLDFSEPYKIVQVQGFEKAGDVVTQTFVVVIAAAYRHPGDADPGVGMAWEIFPGRTPYTRGSELQNAETSAWGRAIIAVGASDSKRGIASREEVRNRQAEREDRGNSTFCTCSHLKREEHSGEQGCLLCECGLAWNADGSLSRSRTSDAEKAAAGVMTAEQRAHNALAKPPPNSFRVERVRVENGITDTTLATVEGALVVDAAVDDRWTTDAPSWLVGVDPPEDQPGSILPAQLKQIHAVYSALKVGSTARHDDARKVVGVTVESFNDLSYQQAARLLENLHERHTGKMTRR